MNNLVLFDKATYDKLLKEVPSYKLITPSVVSERLKIRGSLARAALEELQQKGNELCVVFFEWLVSVVDISAISKASTVIFSVGQIDLPNFKISCPQGSY